MSDHDEATVDALVEDKAGVRLPPPADPLGDARRDFAAQLVEEARATGVNLVGPGGLLTDITKRVFETGLEAEMSEHLGYEKHAVEGRDGGNSRNGTRGKTVLTASARSPSTCREIGTGPSTRCWSANANAGCRAWTG